MDHLGLLETTKVLPIAPPVALPTTSATVGPPTLAKPKFSTRDTSIIVDYCSSSYRSLYSTTHNFLYSPHDLNNRSSSLPLKSSSVTATSVAALSIDILRNVSHLPSTQSFVETTLQNNLYWYQHLATALPTGLVPSPPSITVQSGHDTLGPGQEAGIAVGTIGVFNLHLTIMIYFLDTDNRAAGFIFILTLMFLLFKWRKGELPQWLSCLRRSLPGKVGNSRWPSRSLPAPDMSDSLLTAEAGLER